MTKDQSPAPPRPRPKRKLQVAVLIASPAIVAVLAALTVSVALPGRSPAHPAVAAGGQEVAMLRATQRVLAAAASKASAQENAAKEALDTLRTAEASASKVLAARRADLQATEALRSVAPNDNNERRNAQAALARATEELAETQARVARAEREHAAAQSNMTRADQDAAAAARAAERIASDTAAQVGIAAEVARGGGAGGGSRSDATDWGPVLASLVTGLFGVLTTWLAHRWRGDNPVA